MDEQGTIMVMKGKFARFRPLSTAPFLTLPVIAFTKFSAISAFLLFSDFVLPPHKPLEDLAVGGAEGIVWYLIRRDPPDIVVLQLPPPLRS